MKNKRQEIDGNNNNDRNNRRKINKRKEKKRKGKIDEKINKSQTCS